MLGSSTTIPQGRDAIPQFDYHFRMGTGKGPLRLLQKRRRMIHLVKAGVTWVSTEYRSLEWDVQNVGAQGD
jgi:hypothetical protein